MVGQYYNFLRLGRAGYTHVMQMPSGTARWFADQLESCHHFDVISDGSAIPVVAFKCPGTSATPSSMSRRRCAHTAGRCPPTPWDGAEDVAVLRVVVREGFSADLARSLWEDLNAVLGHLDAIGPDGHFEEQHFAH